jgi:hypothetical protein
MEVKDVLQLGFWVDVPHVLLKGYLAYYPKVETAYAYGK